jgi:hypothetical protein
MWKLTAVGLMVLTVAGCRSRSLLADAKDVQVSREEAGKDCHEIGMLTGTTNSVKGTQQQALDDLKKEAADKGANYVQVKEYSALGTSVTGYAYECP